MKTSILTSLQPTVHVLNPLQEAGSGFPANRKLDPRNDTLVSNFQTALDNVDANNLPKINGSGVSLLKLPQRIPVATPVLDQPVTSTSIKDPGVTAAATGSSVRETVSGGSLSAGKPVPAKGELAPALPSFRTTTPPAADPAMLDPSLPAMQPTPPSTSFSSSPVSNLPVVQQPEPEPEADPNMASASTPQNVKSSSRPVHTKNNAHADAAPDPARIDRTAEPGHDVKAAIMVPPVPYIPVTAPALPVTVAASSQAEILPRPLDGRSRLPDTPLSVEGEPVVVPDASYNGIAPSGKSVSGMNAAPESHVAVASGSRQIAAMPKAMDVMEPLRHRLGSEATAQLSTTTTSASSVAADTAAPAAVNGIQADPALLLPRDILPPVRAAASIVIGNHAQAAVQQIAPALVSLVTRTDGSNGTTAVTITASNLLTLQELSQNVHHLHAALDAASVPVDGRVMNFVMASAVTAEQNQNASGRSASSPQDGNGGTSGGQDHKSWQNRQSSSIDGTVDDTSTHRDLSIMTTRRTWQLNSLNITA